MTETPHDQFQRAREERLARRKPRNPFLDSLESGAMNGFSAALERASWQQCRYLGMWLGLAFHGALRKRLGLSRSDVALSVFSAGVAQTDRVPRSPRLTDPTP